MSFTEVTDEQILKEVGEILTENPQLRKCIQCSYANDDCTRCSKLDKPIAKWMYAGMCKFYETHEERLIRNTREVMKEHAAKEKRINHVLTMSLTTLAVSQLFLDYFQEMVEEEYKIAEFKGIGSERVRKADRAWMATIRRASKAMKTHIEGAQKQYQHYIMPTYNKVFFDKDTGEYDVESYDDHQSDVFEIAEINMRYFDAAFLNLNNAHSIKEMLKTYSTSKCFTEADYKRFNFRR